jgi:hypothetical protein
MTPKALTARPACAASIAALGDSGVVSLEMVSIRSRIAAARSLAAEVAATNDSA